MNEKEILERFGISKKFAYGLFIQSILVIISAIFALNTLQFTFFNEGVIIEYISAILIFLTCISLVIYSFYEYNKNKQYFFIVAIILYGVNCLLWVVTDSLYYLGYSCAIWSVILMALEALLLVYFLFTSNKNYTGAKYALIFVIIFEIINGAIWCLTGVWPVFAALPYIIITVSIALTYFERVQRGKYSKLL